MSLALQSPLEGAREIRTFTLVLFFFLSSIPLLFLFLNCIFFFIN